MACLELFSNVNRATSREEAAKLFRRAVASEPGLALQIMLHLRDVKGNGEKRASRWLMIHLSKHHPQTYRANLEDFAAKYGCYKDLCELYAIDYRERGPLADDAPLRVLADAVAACHPMACKWAPSEKGAFNSRSNGSQAYAIRDILNITSRQYRLILSHGRKCAGIVESDMCSNRWHEIDFAHVPSRAMRAYSKNAFPKHCSERFSRWKIAANPALYSIGSLSFPVDETSMHTVRDIAKELRDRGRTSVFPLIDTSGSMQENTAFGLRPLQIAVPLGVIAAMASGFDTAAMNFHGLPCVHSFGPYPDIADAFDRVYRMAWSGYVDFVNALLAVLNHAILNHIPRERFPRAVLVLTDMSFDEAANHRVFESTRPRVSPHDAAACSYDRYGYPVPTIVHWNIANRKNDPAYVLRDDKTVLLSGISRGVVQMVMDFHWDDPPSEQEFMRLVVGGYDPVAVTGERGNLL